MKERHFTSRKFLAYLITSSVLIIAAKIVTNGNFPSLATALVAMGSAFIVGNTVAAYVPGGTSNTNTTTTTTKTEEAD
jgi:hypothetical protein